MNAFDLIDIAFTALERRKSSPIDPQQPRNRFSYAPVEGSTPTADVGTADVSDLRYFTVRVGRNGRTIYEHVQAPHTWAASKAALEANPTACCAQVVREIDRTEFERLQRHR